MTREFDEIRVIFGNSSQKETAMYEAVIEMMKEHYHFNQIKVSDITQRAGIGKGTAYEYFSSKDEIVVKALLYDAFQSMRKVEMYLKGTDGFERKFYWLMEYMEKNIEKVNMLNELLHIKGEQLDKLSPIKDTTCEEKKALVCQYVNTIADYYMEQGVQEGILAESCLQLRRNCLYTQFLGHMVMVMTGYHGGTVSPEKARKFAYQSLVKSLNGWKDFDLDE